MGENVHFWSDMTGDWRNHLISAKTDADAHSEGTGTSTQITSIENLKSVLRAMLKFNAVLDSVDFHTHGSPGSIRLGSENLNFNNVVTSLNQQSFDTLFSKDATITFTGCNVGEKYKGEMFLALVGRILLGTSGGKAVGSTGLGFADGFWSGDVYHPFGSWVTAHVAVGGIVTLENHSHLIPEKIRERITECAARIADSQSDSLELKHFSPAKKHLRAIKAKKYLRAAKAEAPDDGSDLSFQRMFRACYYLEVVEQELLLMAAVEPKFLM